MGSCGFTDTALSSAATSSPGGCNSPGKGQSRSFIFDILVMSTAQDCEKGRGSPSSCCPWGDVGTGTGARQGGSFCRFAQVPRAGPSVAAHFLRNGFRKSPVLPAGHLQQRSGGFCGLQHPNVRLWDFRYFG